MASTASGSPAWEDKDELLSPNPALDAIYLRQSPETVLELEQKEDELEEQSEEELRQELERLRQRNRIRALRQEILNERKATS